MRMAAAEEKRHGFRGKLQRLVVVLDGARDIPHNDAGARAAREARHVRRGETQGLRVVVDGVRGRPRLDAQAGAVAIGARLVVVAEAAGDDVRAALETGRGVARLRAVFERPGQGRSRCKPQRAETDRETFHWPLLDGL